MGVLKVLRVLKGASMGLIQEELKLRVLMEAAQLKVALRLERLRLLVQRVQS